MTVPSFESLRVWHDARRLASRVYQLSNEGPLARDFGLRDQMRRAAISIMANIAEGSERGGDKMFVHFLLIAKGSAGELRSHLYAAEDIGYLDARICATARNESTVVARRIASLISRIKARGHPPQV